MLFLSALLLAAPPLAAPPDPVAIAFRLAETASADRVELLNEFSQLWGGSPWAARAKAALQAHHPAPIEGALRPPWTAAANVTHGHAAGLPATALPAVLTTRLVWRALGQGFRPPVRPADATWEVGAAPDMQHLLTEVQRRDRYEHAQHLVNLAQAHWQRGDAAAARASLTEAAAELRRQPEVEFAALAWDEAQTLCLALGDLPTALDLTGHRASGGLDALKEIVDHLMIFDQADQVLAVVPALFAYVPGIDDDSPEPAEGCAAWPLHALRWATLAKWSEGLLFGGFYALHDALIAQTPDASMREALRAAAVESLLANQRHDAAWAVFAQMGLDPSELKAGVCAGIEVPSALRRAARQEIIDSASDAELSAMVLQAVESAFEVAELSQIQWDAVISVAQASGEIPALAAIVGKARTPARRDAQLEWAEAMLLGASRQSIHLARAIISPLLTQADQIAELDEAIKAADEALAEAALPDDEVVLPEERLAGELELAQLYFERGDTERARAAVGRLWSALEYAASAGEVAAADWLIWARLNLLLDQGGAAVKQVSGLAPRAAKMQALRAVGEAAVALRQPEVGVAVARAVVRATHTPAEAPEIESDRCTSPMDAVVTGAVEPGLIEWVHLGRFDVAVQIARQLPPRAAGHRLAALVAQMASEGRFAEALEHAPAVPAAAPGCAAHGQPLRDIAWLGLIEEALEWGRFDVARRAIIAMPTAPVDAARFEARVRGLFDELAEAERMPDLSPALGSAAVPEVKAVVEREVVRQHLARGRLEAALAMGKHSDRRTRMRLLLALAAEPAERLAAHAQAIVDLGR